LVTFDANLLIYAYNGDSPHHPRASRWVKEILASHVEIGIPFASILAFIRISTHPKLLVRPASMTDALAVIDAWLAKPQVQILVPGSAHWAIFSRLYLESKALGKLATDIHLAALAIEHGATLYSADRDFCPLPGS
jgi:hypothetical protein